MNPPVSIPAAPLSSGTLVPATPLQSGIHDLSAPPSGGARSPHPTASFQPETLVLRRLSSRIFASPPRPSSLGPPLRPSSPDPAHSSSPGSPALPLLCRTSPRVESVPTSGAFLALPSQFVASCSGSQEDGRLATAGPGALVPFQQQTSRAFMLFLLLPSGLYTSLLRNPRVPRSFLFFYS